MACGGHDPDAGYPGSWSGMTSELGVGGGNNTTHRSSQAASVKWQQVVIPAEAYTGRGGRVGQPKSVVG